MTWNKELSARLYRTRNGGRQCFDESPTRPSNRLCPRKWRLANLGQMLPVHKTRGKRSCRLLDNVEGTDGCEMRHYRRCEGNEQAWTQLYFWKKSMTIMKLMVGNDSDFDIGDGCIFYPRWSSDCTARKLTHDRKLAKLGCLQARCGLEAVSWLCNANANHTGAMKTIINVRYPSLTWILSVRM